MIAGVYPEPTTRSERASCAGFAGRAAGGMSSGMCAGQYHCSPLPDPGGRMTSRETLRPRHPAARASPQ